MRIRVFAAGGYVPHHASSLAAWANGRIWTSMAAGLLLFPLLPAAWELWVLATPPGIPVT